MEIDLAKVDPYIRHERKQIASALRKSVKKVTTQGAKTWGHEGSQIGDK